MNPGEKLLPKVHNAEHDAEHDDVAPGRAERAEELVHARYILEVPTRTRGQTCACTHRYGPLEKLCRAVNTHVDVVCVCARMRVFACTVCVCVCVCVVRKDIKKTFVFDGVFDGVFDEMFGEVIHGKLDWIFYDMFDGSSMRFSMKRSVKSLIKSCLKMLDGMFGSVFDGMLDGIRMGSSTESSMEPLLSIFAAVLEGLEISDERAQRLDVVLLTKAVIALCRALYHTFHCMFR